MRFGVVAADGLPPHFFASALCVVGWLIAVWWVWVKLVVGERLLVVAIVMSDFFWGGVVFGGV